MLIGLASLSNSIGKDNVMASKPNPFAHLLSKPKASAPSTPPKENTLSGWNETIQQMAEKNISESVKKDLTNLSNSDNSFSMQTKEKETTGTLTPQAQLLMGANGETPEFEPLNTGETFGPSTTQELALIDTSDETQFEPKTQIEKNINVRANEMAKSMVLGSESEVRNLCDRIDEMILKCTGPTGVVEIVGPSLGEIRNSVQSLMITLKQRPEFDSVLIAKDVRHVMQYIRATREEALSLREIKTEKKVVRAIKGEAKKKSLKGFEAAFNNVMFKFPGS